MTEVINHTNGAAPLADQKGEEILAPTITGLCIIGTLTKTERRGATSDFEGFLTGYVQTAYGEYKVDIARQAQSITGYVDLAAYDKLTWPGATGKQWCIVVGARNSTAANGRTYTNYTAVDAFPL